MDTPILDNAQRSTDPADYQALPHPVAVMPKVFADGHRIPAHRHARDQLLFAIRGVMRVGTGLDTWVVPPDRALLMPAGQEHSVEMRGEVQMRTLYISPSRPARIKVLKVTPLLRELISELALEPMDFSGRPRAELIAKLINAEMDRADSVPLTFPLPSDPRLQRLCLRLIEEPSLDASLELLADEIGASAKTLARLCSKELGMRFSEWRRRMRFSAAVERLDQGEPIKSVARSCGYHSASAFTHAFKAEFGVRPSEFRSHQRRAAD
ncbi:MAG: helix-turn-helix transcriptional regulator [Pseudomonadota bacterium]